MTNDIVLPWQPVQIAGVEILTSITDAEAGRLTELAAGRTVLEVGSAYGYSAIVMGLVASLVVAVDPHAGELPNSLPRMIENLDLTGVSTRVVVLTERSQECLPGLLEDETRFDLVFVDGDHSKDACLEDLRNGWELLREGGTLAVHDWGEVSCPGVAEAIGEVGWTPDQVTDTLAEFWKP